ncbi:MAG: DUF2523 family protein [Propionivibrio sp.]
MTSWLAALIQSGLEILLNLLRWLIVQVIDAVSTVVVGALELISLPGDWTSNGLNLLVGGLPDGVGYMLNVTRVPEAIGIVVAAVVIRLAARS